VRIRADHARKRVLLQRNRFSAGEFKVFVFIKKAYRLNLIDNFDLLKFE